MIQTLIKILASCDEGLCNQLIDELRVKVFIQMKDDSSLLQQPALRLLETCMEHANHILWDNLWKTVFHSRVLKYSQHSLANFTIQRLIDCCHDQNQVKKFSKEVLIK